MTTNFHWFVAKMRMQISSLWLSVPFFIAALVASYAMLYGQDIDVEVKVQEMRDEKGHAITFARPGEKVWLYREWCASRDLLGSATTEMSNTETRTIYDLPPYELRTPAGCRNRARPIRIPDDVLPGPYVLTTWQRYVINSFREQVFKLPDLSVLVLAPLEKKQCPEVAQ